MQDSMRVRERRWKITFVKNGKYQEIPNYTEYSSAHQKAMKLQMRGAKSILIKRQED